MFLQVFLQDIVSGRLYIYNIKQKSERIIEAERLQCIRKRKNT